MNEIGDVEVAVTLRDLNPLDETRRWDREGDTLEAAAARIAQGLGGAAVMSLMSGLVRHTYPMAQLGRAIGFNAMVVALTTALIDIPSVSGGGIESHPLARYFVSSRIAFAAARDSSLIATSFAICVARARICAIRDTFAADSVVVTFLTRNPMSMSSF